VNSSTSSFKSYVATLLGLIAAVSLTALLATEWLVRTRVDPNDQVSTHVRLVHSAQEHDAGFGDSHMSCGFYPPPGMVNLAFLSENIESLEYKARAYFVKRTPGRVMVQADAHMFAAHYHVAPARGYNQAYDRPAEEQRTLYIRALEAYHRTKLFAYWKVFLRQGFFENRIKVKPNGWAECNDRWATLDRETRQSRARIRAMQHEPTGGFSKSALAVAYGRLLEYLVQRGARVCLVEFPVAGEYLEQIPKERYQAAREWFGAQAQRLGLRYLAHAAVFAESPELFMDMDHLNPEGARDFSERIMRECFD
jgi:hypothetical protein